MEEDDEVGVVIYTRGVRNTFKVEDESFKDDATEEVSVGEAVELSEVDWVVEGGVRLDVDTLVVRSLGKGIDVAAPTRLGPVRNPAGGTVVPSDSVGVKKGMGVIEADILIGGLGPGSVEEDG